MFTVIKGKKEETQKKIKEEKLKKQNIYFKAKTIPVYKVSHQQQ